MLFVIILFLLINTVITIKSNAGSVLFYKRSSDECWNRNDVAKLHARKIFETVVLPSFPPDKINSKYVKDTLKYFRNALKKVDKINDRHTAQILKEALTDTIGGHMRHELLPNARFAYYAGYIPYRSVRQLHNFYESIKTNLNTQGIGWQPPEQVSYQSNLTVSKILIGPGKPFDPCAYLILTRDNGNCIHIPEPKLDNEKNPSAIALPFKAGGLISLTATDSENVLLKYYTTAARCILRSSPEECRHSDFVNFNNELWHWMKRNVAPHLFDEKLYAAYGGILRVAAAVQNYGKGLSRRNLYEVNDYGEQKWRHPFKALSEKYYIDADWTPQLYIAIVMGTALAVCFLHVCYNVIFGRATGCRCPDRASEPGQAEVAYARVDSNFPAMLPSHHSSPTPDKRHNQANTSRSKAASVGTTVGVVRTRTQPVYDFNENAEKLMAVIMSGNEDETELESSSEDEKNKRVMVRSVVDAKPTSPPRIDAPVSQLKIQRAPHVDRRQMYSTSTVTQTSEVTCCREASDTPWSGSYTTDHSISSVSTKSHTQRSRRSRDLAWARRASKHSVVDQSRSTMRSPTGTMTRSPTGTDNDVNSYTTPPSRR